MCVLITGGAGFIGYHVARCCMEHGLDTVIVDNLNPYYDRRVKISRLCRLGFPDLCDSTHMSICDKGTCTFCRVDITDRDAMEDVFRTYRPQTVIHLAAQAGVRYSCEHPQDVINSNIDGFLNVIDLSRIYGVGHFIYASSSSVYGNTCHDGRMTEKDVTDMPQSLYAATKKSNELVACSYSSMYGMRTTGLRFFSVYGEYGRPDMAIWRWTENILAGNPITVFGDGSMERDFTYIDDVVRCVMLVMKTCADKDTSRSRVFNVGNGKPVSLRNLLSIIERECSRTAFILHEEAPSCDVMRTCADMTLFRECFGYAPSTDIETGIKRFVSWFNGFDIGMTLT